MTQGLSVMLSCGCNLKCEYCRIAQSVNDKSSMIQKETIKALCDGSYIANIEKVLERLDQSPCAIDSIHFWGQEPTLNLHYMTDHLAEWFAAFPNWKSCMFSTNSIAHMDRIVDFCAKLEQTTPHPFELSIQLSYDGEYSTDNLRKASPSTIHDNLIYLFTELNKINFNKVQIRFNHHGVVSLDLLHKMNTIEDIVNYTKHMFDWGEEFYKLNTNSHVHLIPNVDLGLENPVEASVEDGMLLNKFCELSSRAPESDYAEYVKEHPLERTPDQSIYGWCFNTFESLRREMDRYGMANVDELIFAITDDPILRNEIFRDLNLQMYCGNGFGELKVMYDGTLINCQNHIYEADSKYIKDDGTLASKVKIALADHNYFINPITADQQQIDKYFDMFAVAKTGSLEMMFKVNVMLMHYLVMTKQIDVSYFDDLKLVKHALILALQGSCSYNNQIMTGSLYLRHSGFLRFMCNGYLDKSIAFFNNINGGFVV